MENDILEMESLSDAEELEGDARLEMIEEDVGEEKKTLELLFKLLLYLLFGILIGQLAIVHTDGRGSQLHAP